MMAPARDRVEVAWGRDAARGVGRQDGGGGRNTITGSVRIEIRDLKGGITSIFQNLMDLSAIV
jgi:hypothetical protein